MRWRWTLALVLALATAARAAPPPAGAPPPPGSTRVEIHVTFPSWQYAGEFRVESSAGELLDHGTARDDGGFASQDVVLRVLEGARGTLLLRVRRTVVRRTAQVPRFPALFGRWEVVRGTGAYAHAAGGGTFTSCGAGDLGKGSPFELQTLVGRVRLR
jgi:hypothetical protein